MYGVYQSTGIYCDFKQGIILCLDNNPAPVCDCWYLINYEKLLLLWSLYIYIYIMGGSIYISNWCRISFTVSSSRRMIRIQ